MIAGFDLDSFLAGACAGVILHRLRVVWVPQIRLGRKDSADTARQ